MAYYVIYAKKKLIILYVQVLIPVVRNLINMVSCGYKHVIIMHTNIRLQHVVVMQISDHMHIKHIHMLVAVNKLKNFRAAKFLVGL